MKPNKFIMNSDYLALAKVGSRDFTVNISAGTVVAGNIPTQSFNFSVPTINSAIDRTQVSYSGQTVVGSDTHIKISTDATAGIQVYRSSANNIRVNVSFFPYAASSGSWPAFSFNVHVENFSAPNLT